MAFSKRQKTDLSTAEFEITSLKKSVNQHKVELKHLGTVVINDLKSLKEESSLHLSRRSRARMRSSGISSLS